MPNTNACWLVVLDFSEKLYLISGDGMVDCISCSFIKSLANSSLKHFREQAKIKKNEFFLSADLQNQEAIPFQLIHLFFLDQPMFIDLHIIQLFFVLDSTDFKKLWLGFVIIFFSVQNHMKNVGYNEVILCVVLLSFVLTSEASSTIKVDPGQAPCCGEGRTKYCVKTVANCESYRVPKGDCMQCSEGYDLEGGLCKEDGSQLIGDMSNMNYSVFAIGGSPLHSPIEVHFSNATLSIVNGCNLISASYSLTRSGIFTAENFISTYRYCTTDYDGLVIGGLSSAARVVENNGLAVMMNSDGEQTIALKKIVAAHPSISLVGSYSIKLSSDRAGNDFVLRITDEAFFLSGGCNLHQWTYNAMEDSRRITFGKVRSITERACEIDRDSIYLAAILSAAKYEKTEKGFVLVSVLGRASIRMDRIPSTASLESPSTLDVATNPFQDPPSSPSSKIGGFEKFFDGIYLLNFVNQPPLSPQVRVYFSPTRLITNGCDTLHFTYRAFHSGFFKAEFKSSEHEDDCNSENDILSLDALLKVTKYRQDEKDIILSDETSDLLILTQVPPIFDVSPATPSGVSTIASTQISSPSLKIDTTSLESPSTLDVATNPPQDPPSSPGSKIGGFEKFFDGIYLLNFVNQPPLSPQVRVYFSPTRLITNGCDTLHFTYRAFHSGFFKAEFKSSEHEDDCNSENDILSLDALLKVTKYRQDEKDIILSDETSDLLILTQVPPIFYVSPATPSGVNTIASTQISSPSLKIDSGEKDLSGTYKMKLPNSPFHPSIRVEFDPNMKMYGGCRIHYFTYIAFASGAFQAEVVRRTMQSCDKDDDEAYVKALEEATKMSGDKHCISLSDGNSYVAFLVSVSPDQDSPTPSCFFPPI